MFGQIREYARFVASLTQHLLKHRSCHHSCTTNTHRKTAAAAGFVLCKPPGDESDNKPANLGVFSLRSSEITTLLVGDRKDFPTVKICATYP